MCLSLPLTWVWPAAGPAALAPGVQPHRARAQERPAPVQRPRSAPWPQFPLSWCVREASWDRGARRRGTHLVPSALSTGTGLVRMHRGSVILRNISDQRTLSYAFFLVLLPRISQPLTPKRMTAWKGTLTQPLVPFPSGLSLLVGEQKAECWEAGHVSRSEVETVELDLYRVVCRSGKSHRICKCQGIKYQCVILKM